jgi:CheY-like chemotaxis protein
MSKRFDVLLVEDNPADIDLTRELLHESDMPVEVKVATNGSDAVDLLLGSSSQPLPYRPDLVLLDLNLPNKNGHEVLSEIKQVAGVRQIPVLVFSSSDAHSDVTLSYELGANCYLVKPGSLRGYRSLLETVRAFWLRTAELPNAE